MSIRAVIFDLDGTLVQTEKLKAQSYAQATVELCPFTVAEAEVIEEFKNVVGLSRKEVAEHLIDKYKLTPLLEARQEELSVGTLWQSFVQIRLSYYEAMLANPDVLVDNQWEHNVDLLRTARKTGCYTALATMSHCEQATKVLDILDLGAWFDFVATRDDVENGKPDPEIYNLVRVQLDVPADQCLVIEDSPSGVKAAKAAGMHVVVVTTPFTREGIRAGSLLDPQHIVDDPKALIPVIQQFAGVIPE